MSGYFFDWADDVRFPTSVEDDFPSYRTCQCGAYWALKSHLTIDDGTPAILSLPTGAGKTALMMLTAFAIKSERVLIIAPSDAIRTQLVQRFSNLEGLFKAHALTDILPEVNVSKIENRMTDEASWEEYEEADVVVTLPHDISSEYNQTNLDDIQAPPEQFFDLVMIDEAHHSSAPAWQTILEGFDDAVQVLFTATPFRRSRESLPGRLAYHYPIDQAVKDGIYHPIRLTTVDVDSEDGRSEDGLIEEAVDQLQSLQESNDKAAMLVRTNRINRANTLAERYQSRGLDVAAVHSENSKRKNTDMISKLGRGSIDGVVVVNKLAEGLDVANLQLAVLHNPPRSLRLTIQLIGRLARSPDTGDSDATIIASRATIADDRTEQAVRRLYHESTAWYTVAPELVSEYIDIQNNPTETVVTRSPRAVSEGDIRPYTTVDVYSISDTQVDPSVTMSFERFDVTQLHCSDEGQFVGYITVSTESPTWAANTVLEARRYDLHLFYIPDGSGYLFQYASNRRQGNRLREKMIRGEDNLSQVNNKQLTNVMQSLKNVRYQVTGLANTSVPSGSTPQYKTYHGDDVQGAVYHSDSRMFSRGHVFASFEDEDERTATRGLSGSNSRIWSNRKRDLSEFKQWCDSMTELLSTGDANGVQNLEMLDNTEPVEKFEEPPFAAIFNPRLAGERVEISGDGFDRWESVEPSFVVDTSVEGEQSEIEVSVNFTDSEIVVNCSYDVSTDTWSGQIDEYQLRVPDSRKIPAGLTGSEFLERYPPIFYTEAGAIVIGGEKRESEIDLSSFVPGDCRASDQIIWSNFGDVVGTEEPSWYTEVEQDVAEQMWSQREPSSVHEALAAFLKGRSDDESQVLFYDHKSNEIADIIEFLPTNEEINFYHCKKGSSPGVSLGRFTDIYQQAIRSLRYTYTPNLLTHINDRESPGTLQHFITGKDAFEEISSDFRPHDWTYTIYGVNPGLDVDFAPEISRDNRNVGRLLAECVEQIEQCNVEFAIHGAQE
jgi:superfamily II DNA or RNA helicase